MQQSLVRVVTLPFRDELEGFDESALLEVMDGREVAEASHHFFTRDGDPWVYVFLRLRESSRRPTSGEERRRGAKKPQVTDRVPPEDRSLFEALRSWRKARADAQNVPTYLVCNDETLVALAKERPPTKTALASIRGIGEQRIASFGEEVIAVISQHAQPVEVTDG